MKDTLGTVSFLCCDSHLELNVRVAHTGSVGDGLEFIYESEREQAAVARLIASLATQ